MTQCNKQFENAWHCLRCGDWIDNDEIITYWHKKNHWRKEMATDKCNKQFDPLKPCKKQSGLKIDYLHINADSEKPILAYAQENSPKYKGNHFVCGHYYANHADSPDDLINVEEEKGFDKDDVKRKFADINEALDFTKGCVKELQALLSLYQL